jgi:hypothetical protein
MSNAMDIVDAMTVAGPAEVTHWDEQEDEQEDLGQRFFRQFLDIKKLGGAKGSEMSALRQHCICHNYYNPNKTIYKCPHGDCGMWNHEECLVDAILDKKYEKLVEESGPAANGTERATQNSTLKMKKLNGTKGGQGMLNAKINHADEAAGKGLEVTITDKSGQDPETWVEHVRCLKCGQVLD